MADQKVRISELPISTATSGLKTIGVNAQNESVQIPIGDIVSEMRTSTSNAQQAADQAVASVENVTTELGTKADKQRAVDVGNNGFVEGLDYSFIKGIYFMLQPGVRLEDVPYRDTLCFKNVVNGAGSTPYWAIRIGDIDTVASSNSTVSTTVSELYFTNADPNYRPQGLYIHRLANGHAYFPYINCVIYDIDWDALPKGYSKTYQSLRGQDVRMLSPKAFDLYASPTIAAEYGRMDERNNYFVSDLPFPFIKELYIELHDGVAEEDAMPYLENLHLSGFKNNISASGQNNIYQFALNSIIDGTSQAGFNLYKANTESNPFLGVSSVVSTRLTNIFKRMYAVLNWEAMPDGYQEYNRKYPINFKRATNLDYSPSIKLHLLTDGVSAFGLDEDDPYAMEIDEDIQE